MYSPVRFYASVVMKMNLAHLIVDFKFKLADPTSRSYLTMGLTRLSSSSMKILVQSAPSVINGLANSSMLGFSAVLFVFVLWSLDFRVGVSHGFSRMNFGGNELMQGRSLTPQQVKCRRALTSQQVKPADEFHLEFVIRCRFGCMAHVRKLKSRFFHACFPV